ncbi:MAG: zinc ABC transporter substrate-binding protein, partial [Lentisphaeria bacterium]|nr:zinc ABC transporter substrate-binding protein [Lentisphaeria bacterium]
HQGGHGHGHGEDPHVWLSLRNLSSMAAIVAEALTRHLPEHGDVIARNLAAYRSSLGRLDAEFARRLGPLRGQAFYIYHPALGHFAADYGLVQRPVEIEGKSPSPRQLAALVERARAEGVRVVFVQPQFQQRPAQILAERIGGRVVPLNPMASDPLAELRLAVDTLCPNQDKTGD